MGSIIMGRFKFLLFVLLLVTISFSATTWYVSTTGKSFEEMARKYSSCPSGANGETSASSRKGRGDSDF
jgi:hypothetical protein